MYINKHYLPKKAQKSFMDIIQNLKTYNYRLIENLIPENCDFSAESLKEIKERLKMDIPELIYVTEEMIDDDETTEK